MGRVAAVDRVPGAIGQACNGGIVAVAETRGGSGPGSVFPFRFRGQSVMAAGRNPSCSQLQFSQPGAIIGRIQPTHAFDRSVQVTRETAWIGADHRQIFLLSHLVFPHPKTVNDGDGCSRAFIGGAPHFVRRAAQFKCVRRYEHHVRRGTLQERAVETVACNRCCRINKQIVRDRQSHKAHARPGVALGEVGGGLNDIDIVNLARHIHPGEQLEAEAGRSLGGCGVGAKECYSPEQQA